MRYLCLLISLGALCAHSPLAASADDQAARGVEAQSVSVAVADFTGDDRAIGKFISDTLLTDLSQSRQMRLVERGEIQKAQNELRLNDGLQFEPQQIRTLGRMVRADRIVVGSYLIRDSQVMVNARLLDVATGRVVTGGAANSVGDAKSMFGVVHRLAHLLHRRITGADLVIDGEGPDPTAVRDQTLRDGPNPSYRVGQNPGSTSSGNPVSPRPVEPAPQPNGYRVHENAGAADIVPPTRIVTQPVYVPVPQPVYVPPYYSYPSYFGYPYIYSYPSYFSFGISLGFSNRSSHFSRFGGFGHIGGFSHRGRR
jgi:TolB-like protein